MSATSSLALKAFYRLRGLNRETEVQSRLKVLFTGLFFLALEGGLLALFLSGFRFLGRLGQIGPMIVHHLFALFFLGLGAMLVTSSVLGSYATLFRSAEVPSLMVRPFRMGQIAVYKALESCLLSSWAFFIILLPFIGAHAWHERLNPLFALWAGLFSAPFVVLCSGAGTVVTILVVRWSPRGRALKTLGVLLLAAVAVGVWSLIRASRVAEDPNRVVLNRLVPGLQAASYPLLPSWWMSEGFACFVRGTWARGVLLWILMASHALMVLLAVEALGARLYFEGWQRVSAAAARARTREEMFAGLGRLLGFLGRDVRALLLKDLRTLARDPLQWSQFLIFFGLLGLYFASLRSFRYDDLPVPVRSAIAFLNIFSVATVLCSLASRFIYPQLSLEGQSFWVLGLSPTTMGKILLTKFGLSAAAMCTVSVGLMALSTVMLRLDAGLQAAALGLAFCLALGVSGLSTGMGALYLDLSQRNPSAIVSGFGGTLNLVLSLGFMLAAVLPVAAVSHLQRMGRLTSPTAGWIAAAAWGWVVLLTAVATSLPIVLGRRSLQRREY